MIVEICCGSYEDAKNAWEGGAKRIELNSALFLGGLTPSVADIRLTKEKTGLEIITMIRPRGAGFVYTNCEKEVMFADAKIMLEEKSDGLAFGFLTENFEIDTYNTKKMVDLIHSYGKTAVFHRAFDCTIDYDKAINQLIEIGVDRILTSGLFEKAYDGIEILAEIQEKYGEKVEILAGSGINYNNAKEIVEKTRVKQIHTSCKTWKKDITTTGKNITYSFNGKNEYDAVSKDLVEKILKVFCD